jgi:thiol-disulfide isomerase/thioredoxin
MRQLFMVCFLVGAGCIAGKAQALKLHTELPDAEEKMILFGQVTKNQIIEDSLFGWYKANAKYAKPPQSTIDAIKKAASKVDVVLFVGTWCHDTQQILPKYFKAMEASGFPEERLTIVATNRSKEAPGGWHRVFKVVNVPTIIVLQDGKELGRISEYGDTGTPDKELGDIFNKAH